MLDHFEATYVRSHQDLRKILDKLTLAERLNIKSANSSEVNPALQKS